MVIFLSCKEEKLPFQIQPAPSINKYHGIEIVDEYSNLEDLNDSTVIDWMRNQSDYAFSTLNKIPGRKNLIELQKSLYTESDTYYSFVRYSSNGRFFYIKRKEKEKNPKIYYKDNLASDEQLLYDLNIYPNITDYRLSYLKPDWSGNKVALGFSKKGEETSKIIILDVLSRKILPGQVENCLTDFAGIHWLSDDSGFIYLMSENNDPSSDQYWMNMKSILYKINEGKNEKIEVFSKSHDPELNLNAEDFPLVYNYDSNDGYLFAVIGGASSYYDVYYKKESNLLSKNSKWIPLYKESDKVKQIRVDNDDNLIFLTTKNASNRRICRTPMSNPDFENPEILVPEYKSSIITKFHITKDGLYFSTQKNGIEEKLFKLNEKDKIEEIKLPREVTEMNIQSQSIDQPFLKISTWDHLSPGIHYIYNFEKKEFEVEPIAPLKVNDNFKDLVVKNFEIESHDGVMVPVTIIHKRDIIKDGNNPTLFYGYGSYGGTGSVSFNPNFLSWAVNGGILVYSYVRGGGQKGDDWYKGGFKETKPNTWKDMIATTEFLIDQGYTNSNKTAVWGSSAGGILAGRAMTERPDLYKAVMLTSPAMNMLKSEIQPNGKNSIKEFGTVEIEEEFRALYEMDSYHHIEEGIDYPATFVTGGFKDGRVVIWDPAKFVAKLQAYNKAHVPILFAVKFDEGHAGADADGDERLLRYANVFSFALWQMGYEEFQPSND